LIADKVVDVVGDKGLSWAVKLIPTHQINMIILLFFYSLMSVDVAFIIATLLVFYISFAAMVLSTLQMFYKRKKLNDIRDIASFLQNFNSAFDKDTARSMYEWTSIKPYVAFFCSVSMCVAAFAVTDRHYIPCPELVLVSLFFTSLSFMALSDQYERLEIASIGLNLFASIPAMFESFPHIPIISTLCRPLFGFVISFEFPSVILRGMHVNIGLPSLAYLVVPMLFMAMAMRRSWRGTYVVLIPHLVCFCWWQAMLVFYRYSSWVGLIRASVGWVLFLVMLPVLAFVVVGYLFFYAVYTVGMADFTKLVITMMLVVVPAGAVYWMRNGFSLPFAGLDRKSLAGKVVFIGVLAACVLSVFFMLSASKLSAAPASRLSYESYYKHCGQPSWEKTSMLDVMLRCTKFQQLTIDWEGTFTGQTTIKEVSSSARQFLEAMPSFFANWLTCVYGQPFGDCSRHDSPDEREFCELATSQGRECHLNNLDRYTFQFTVTMPHGQQIRGEASYVFKSILLQLRPGDTIAIHGHLVDSLGSASPLVRIQYIECTSCSPRHRYMCEEMLDESVRTLGRLRPGFTEMWNFFFAPVLQFDRADGQ
jgi:wolfamin